MKAQAEWRGWSCNEPRTPETLPYPSFLHPQDPGSPQKKKGRVYSPHHRRLGELCGFWRTAVFLGGRVNFCAHTHTFPEGHTGNTSPCMEALFPSRTSPSSWMIYFVFTPPSLPAWSEGKRREGTRASTLDLRAMRKRKARGPEGRGAAGGRAVSNPNTSAALPSPIPPKGSDAFFIQT